MSRKGNKTKLVVILAFTIIVGTTIFLALTGRAPNTGPSTTLGGLRTAFNQHLMNFDNRSIPDTLGDYQDNATILWTGQTAGLGGSYPGIPNIRLLLASVFSSSQSLSLVPIAYKEVQSGGQHATVTSLLNVTGSSKFLGNFTGEINATIDYRYGGNAWKISNESWDYTKMVVSSSGGATTFPEWQVVGPPIQTRRGPDWLHNFVWDFGAPVVVALIYSIMVILVLLTVVRRARFRH